MRPKIHMGEASTHITGEATDYYIYPNAGVRECTESRPPLEMNATGPTPCTYSLPSPSYSRIGGKINPRAKYDRGIIIIL